MSQGNVKVVRRLYETADKRGWDAAIASPDVHDGFELTSRRVPSPRLSFWPVSRIVLGYHQRRSTKQDP
jgi:hypothetical protein